MGVGGLILALVLIPVLKEPVRGLYDKVSGSDEIVPLWESLVAIARNKGLVVHIISHVMITCTTTIFIIWANAYSMRVLKFSLSEAGLVTGASGFLTVVGILGGGWICSKLIATKQDDRWIAGFSGLVAFICAVGLAIMLWSSSHLNFFIGFSIASLMIFARVAPAMTLSTDLVHPRMRGLSSALTVGLSSLVGGGLAPVFMGQLSDYLGSSVGAAEGLRLALLYTTVPCALIGAILAGVSALLIGKPKKFAGPDGLA
jgi:sugar phosphate permease